jgi:hypothetical protein
MGGIGDQSDSGRPFTFFSKFWSVYMITERKR